MQATALRMIAATALAAAAASAFAPAPAVHAAARIIEAVKLDAASLEVSVTGVTDEAGRIWVGVYASAEDWEAGREAASGWIETGGAPLRLEGLNPGTLAVQVFHDVNANGDFDRNMLGAPRERYGFSNDPRPRFRSASFSEAAFTLAPGEAAAITIALHGVSG